LAVTGRKYPFNPGPRETIKGGSSPPLKSGKITLRSAHNSLDAAVAPRAWALQGPAIFLAAYLLVHFALRLLMAPTLGIDDAEQVLFAQDWAWGYRFRQPPLFTWLLLPVSEVTGPGILAVSLVRYALIGLYLLFFHLTALRWVGDRQLAALATGSNVLIYVFAYYAHHDLTHTTMLATMIAMTFYVLARLMERPAALDYLLLGVCFGLGMLSKWNFAFLIAAVTLGLLLVKELRGLVLSRKALLTALAAAATTAPTLIWMYGQGQGFIDLAARISAPRGGAPEAPAQALIDGSAAWALALVTFPQPFLVIFLLVFAGALRRALKPTGRAPAPASDGAGAPPATAILRFMGFTMIIAAVLYWALVPLVGAVTFKERWMHPVLAVLPIFLFAFLRRGQVSAKSVRIYLAVILVVSLAALGARAGRYLLGADYCGKCRELAPFGTLARDLGGAGFTGGTIVAGEFHVGGNLRAAFPESRVMEISYPPKVWPEPRPGEAGGQCLAVWRATTGDAMPAAVSRYLTDELAMADAVPDSRGVLEAKMQGSETKTYRLGYALFAPGAGDCR
jgi:hypothetical protein